MHFDGQIYLFSMFVGNLNDRCLIYHAHFTAKLAKFNQFDEFSIENIQNLHR